MATCDAAEAHCEALDYAPFAPTAPARNYAILAIDPGGTTGWCWMRADRSFTTGVLSVAERLVKLRELVTQASEEPLLVAIETYPVRTGYGPSSRYLGPLMGSVTDIRLLVESMGHRPLMVHPPDWQHRILRYGGRQATTKIAARRACQHLTGKRVRTDHEADAVCLAAYVLGL